MAKVDYATLLKDIEADIKPKLEEISKSKNWESITAWLAKLFLLEGVPFRYLVPDERMLPPESIKYFQIDQNWLTALIDGAYSIGRTSSGDSSSLSEWLESEIYPHLTKAVQQNANTIRWSQLHPKKAPSDSYKNDNLAQQKPFMLSGFLLRSQALKDFPNMQIVGFDQNNVPTSNSAGQALPVIRLDHLSEEVLIGIFVGDVYRIDFRQPSEGLHYGFDEVPGSGSSTFLKKLRDDKGIESETVELTATDGIFRSTSTTEGYTPTGAVINMNALSKTMFDNLKTNLPNAVPYSDATTTEGNPVTTLTSADFALQMTEGAAMVSFILKK